MGLAVTSRVRMAGLFAGLGLALGVGIDAAQQSVFRGSTDLVLLTVTADDGQGRPITGLTVDDFEVFEDRRPQTIEFFAREPQPISLSILIDSSSSMDRKIRTAQEGAAGFVQSLRPEDQAQIITFNSSIEILQDFTGDVDALDAAIRRTRPGGSTSLYSAIAVAFNEMSQEAIRWQTEDLHRQAIVVLSDGEDTTSLLGSEELLAQASRSDVVIYAIALRDPGAAGRSGFNSSAYVLRTLSQSTGGRVFFVDDIAQLQGIYTQIADELANQYMIGFISTNTVHDGTWRELHVRVTEPGVAARTRTGYYAPKADR